jgi:hypothetical protein
MEKRRDIGLMGLMGLMRPMRPMGLMRLMGLLAVCLFLAALGTTIYALAKEHQLKPLLGLS